MQSTPVYLVSACLVGLRTRYDGGIVLSPACRKALDDAIWIPVCPEQLGGLATPRISVDIEGGDGADVLAGRARVLSRSGLDLTENFIAGAGQVLEIARSQSITAVFLKARSPSCGVNSILGVTAALLRQHGFSLREF